MTLLRGATTVVTGASTGIGAALAPILARRGSRTVLLARSADALASVADGVRAAGGTAHVFPADLTDAAAVERAARAVEAETGPPDVLVNNAGAGRFLCIDETSPEEAVQMMAAPYFAAFFVTRAFLPGMLARGRGHIVNVSAPASVIAFPGQTGYASARWAVRGFTEALRADLRGTGIRVSLALPGKVQSEYFAHNPGSEERVPRIAKLVPTLTSAEAAESIARGIERDQRTIVAPFLLRLFFAWHAVMPRVVEHLVVSSGWKHPRAR
jgi:short-subunit dehydrogenase